MLRGLIASIALLAPPLGACTGGMYDPATVEQQNGACIALEGRTFVSINELECGGASRCHWGLTFATKDATASDFAWNYSDTSEHGRVECRGQGIKATGGRAMAGTFDPSSQMLLWGGEVYVAAP